MNPGEQLDALYDKYMAQVAEDEKDNIIIKSGKPHLKVDRPDGDAFCFFDHRFWYFDNSMHRYLIERGKPVSHSHVCPASEDYHE